MKSLPVAFVFQSQSPHLQRLISSVESMGHKNQGVFIESKGNDLEVFLSTLNPNTLILSGPMNLSSLPWLLKKFEVLCFSFATDIFLDNAEKDLITELDPSQLGRLRIVVDTEEAKSKLLLAGYSVAQIALIPWSFGLKGLKNIQKPSKSGATRQPKIIFGRNTNPPSIYQPMLALKVLEFFSEKFNSVSLTVVTNEVSDDFVFESKKIPNLSLVMLKPIQQDDFAKLISEHDLFLQTNSVDGLSVSMLQSMAVGTPVVSTITAGTKDAIVDGYSGIIFKQDNTEEVSGRIVDLLTSPPSYEFIRKNARSKFIDHFSEKIALEKLTSTISLGR